MNRRLWINRISAAAGVGLLAVAALSAVAIIEDVGAVRAASAREGPATAPAAPARALDLRSLQPVLRRGEAEAGVAIGEFLNGRLGQLGLNVSAAELVSLRPLGRGLELAEVDVQARGDMAAAAAAASWVAVNRESVRLKALTVGSRPDGEAQVSLVLLMVIA